MAPLKKMVDEGELDAKVALKAQDAVEIGDETPNADDAIKLAREMTSMSDAQRRKLVKDRQKSPETTVNDAIERARSGAKITQVNVTLTADAHAALQKFAKDQDTTQDEAAAGIIEEALISRGFLEA